MAVKKAARNQTMATLPKAATGIVGLDEITGGGIPKGRPTLICGSAGCGKTLMAMEFLVRGALEQNEPGVFLAFEENAGELAKNVASLGFDLEDLEKRDKIVLDYVYIERSEIEDTGEYDLEGLFIRLDYAINSIGAKRVVLDTIEALFSGLPNENILRAELRRLFRWLKGKGVTAVITAERGEGALTRHGLEEYVADCVIMLDHRIMNQMSTRRMRIVKYRGSTHGTNEYPFLIDESGISVLPVSSAGLDHKVFTQRIGTGIPRLDNLLGGKGYFRGSSVLVSGTAGTGKTSIAVHFANAACSRGEKALYFASEESQAQIVRNAKFIGINLERWVKKGLLHFHCRRPSYFGLEMHLVTANKLIKEFSPDVVIIDPISSLNTVGTEAEVHAMFIRLLDFVKSRGATILCTNLTNGGNALEQTNAQVSSIMDTWLLLRDNEYNGERTRLMYILKSRGMAHSNQVREFLITSEGIDLTDVYLGDGQVLAGSARLAQEMKETAENLVRTHETERLRRELERSRQLMEARIKELQVEFESKAEQLTTAIVQQETKGKALAADRRAMADIRKADK
jgi:circadian clock protein KaiC